MTKNFAAFCLLAVALVMAVMLQPKADALTVSSTGSPFNASSITTGTLVPARGGAGLMTSAPSWARYFGDGNEGPHTTGTENLGGVHFYTTFNCTGAVSNIGVPGYLVVYATTSITLGASCAITLGTTNGSEGFMGGQGGSGGGGTAAGATGYAMASLGNPLSNSTYLNPPTTGTSSGGAGNNGATEPSYVQQMFLVNGPMGWAMDGSACGGSSGSTGGSSGGLRGRGGTCIAFIAPSITITNGALVNAAATNGAYATASTQGGGGGGGGGVLLLATETLTDNSSGTFFKIGGGSPGGCTTPGVQLSNAAGDSTGVGAILTVTGVTTGGLDASKITITAGGSGYTLAPTCSVVAGASGLTGSPACHTTISGGAVASVVIDTAGSGATFSAFTTCGVGGAGQPGLYKSVTIQ